MDLFHFILSKFELSWAEEKKWKVEYYRMGWNLSISYCIPFHPILNNSNDEMISFLSTAFLQYKHIMEINQKSFYFKLFSISCLYGYMVKMESFNENMFFTYMLCSSTPKSPTLFGSRGHDEWFILYIQHPHPSTHRDVCCKIVRAHTKPKVDNASECGVAY
jgi:hypothetical protein